MDTENILVRGVNWLGDAVMTLPALRRLREARPAARLSLLVPEKLAGLWDGQPLIDNLMTFAPGETVWGVGRRLRAEKFTAAVAFPNSARSAMELWRAGIPRRVGLSRGLRRIFLTEALPPRPGAVAMRKRSDAEIRRAVEQGTAPPAFPARAHHVHDYLYLTERLGASVEPTPPRLEVPAGRMEEAAAKFRVASDGLWLGLNPGAEYGPAKRWPEERFIGAALVLHAKIRCRWLIFGGSADAALAGRIASAIQAAAKPSSVINVAGKTTLGELAALLAHCRLLVTNDTGPMHLAAAVGIPVIVPFGSTAPELTGPIFSAAAIILRSPPPCAPCFRRECPIDLRCLTAIQAREAVDAAQKILEFT